MTLAYEGEPPPLHRKMTATNGFYSFWLIQSGRVTLSGVFGKCVLRAGDWILFPMYVSKHQEFQKGSRLLSLGFEAMWATETPWMEFSRPITGSAAGAGALIRRAREVLNVFPAEQFASPIPERKLKVTDWIRLQGALFRFLTALTPWAIREGATFLDSPARDSRIQKRLLELRKEPSARPVPYARWTEQTGLSRVHLDRLFRAHCGDSPKQIQNRFLLAAIKRELVIGRESVKELAAKFGFSDTSHLCRWFRRRAQTSPEQFRALGIE